MREISLDTETTGFEPEQGHRIVEIGCVEMFNRVRTGKVFHAYINPERDMPPGAQAVHGLSAQFLSDKPKFHEVADHFIAFISDAPLVIHNADFDMKFLSAELGRAAKTLLAFERATDTLKIARKKYPGSPASLDALCKRFNIDLSARTKHGALLDAELLCDVYMELMGGAQDALALISAANQRDPMSHRSAEARPARDFPVPEEDRVAHDAFLKLLKNPLWAKV